MGTFDPTRDRIRELNERRVSRGSRVLQRRLRRAAPKNSGRMASVTTVAPQGLRVQVRVATDYASFTNADTVPHEIVARNAQALRFFWPAAGPPQPKFFRRVQHPGRQNVEDWYGDTLDEWTTILDRT